MHFIPQGFKKLPRSHKIAYIAVFTALSVIANVFSFKIFADIGKLSFVTTVLIMAGAIFGPLIGFVIGMLGDALCFLIYADGVYSPFIGISNGTAALIAGFVFMLFANKSLAIKVIVSGILAYIICTLLISSTALYLLFFSSKYNSLLEFVIYRIATQTPINVINIVISYMFLKSAQKLKIFRLNFS